MVMVMVWGAVMAAMLALWGFRHRRSLAVRAWAPPTATGHKDGPLYARADGDGGRAVVLLHGLVSNGDVFGAPYDILTGSHRTVVPDLLGFGRSIDTERSSFPAEDHLDALDQLAEQTGLLDLRWTIGAHSMGSALALRWASRHPENVERIVCWGAPLYRSPQEARSKISGNTMTRLFALDTAWAERACAISCRHRRAAGWLGAASEPGLPVPIARGASLHTWPAYRDSMRHLVLESDWSALLDELDSRETPVELVWGTEDRVGDQAYARALAEGLTHLTVTLIPDADHHLPMTHPDICLAQLTAGEGL
jgi:pimeloyl-ACP methyl ester carboxylesterase